CLPLPAEHSWVGVELKKHLPVRTDLYESEKKKSAYQAVASDRATAVRLAWFSPDAVEDRTEYVDLDESGEAVARQSFSAPQAPSFGY
ncbi:MAG TPA: hypothetical protein VNT79_03430, partial [Phycisphaerae bacterium]|nr:hypothetical protein [Phycisphaerae bacterium]